MCFISISFGSNGSEDGPQTYSRPLKSGAAPENRLLANSVVQGLAGLLSSPHIALKLVVDVQLTMDIYEFLNSGFPTGYDEGEIKRTYIQRMFDF